MNTPRTANASPWRIKVTVQAEPGTEDENGTSPSFRRSFKTVTTTVPLKDPDAPSSAKRPRGRPKKFDAGLITKPKRNGTPAKRAARSTDNTDLSIPKELNVADEDTDLSPKKAKGHLERNMQLTAEDEPTDTPKALSMASVHTVRPKAFSSNRVTSAVRQRAKRNALRAREEDESELFQLFNKGESESDSRHAEPASNTPFKSMRGGRFRRRKSTPHAKKVIPVESSSDEESSETIDAVTRNSDGDGRESHDVARLLSARMESENPKTVDKNSGTRDTSVGENEEISSDKSKLKEFDVQACGEHESFEALDCARLSFEEEAFRSLEDKTIDNEDFSMISIDSLPSNMSMIDPWKQRHTVNSIIANVPGSKSSVQLSETVPPLALHPIIGSEVTPVLPSDYVDQAIASRGNTPPKDRFVGACVPLQDVPDLSRLTPQLSREAQMEKHYGPDDVFKCFSENTRKELQSSLYFGEQLAREDLTKQPLSAKFSYSDEEQGGRKKRKVLRTQRKYRQSQHPIPEEQHNTNSPTKSLASRSGQVRYPALRDASLESLSPSPAKSESEKTWGVDKPPSDVPDTQQESDSVPEERMVVETSRHELQPDSPDIWQEEASRSSSLLEHVDIHLARSPELQQHLQMSCISNLNLTKSSSPKHDNDVLNSKEFPGEETDSDDNQDTGLFFQSSVSNTLDRRSWSARFQKKKISKQSLSCLVNEGESLRPESSPPAATKTSKSAVHADSLFDASCSSQPSSSLRRSTFLRREPCDVSVISELSQRAKDESTLPMAQSSPSHTFLDGQSRISTASDQQRCCVEIEDSTASTIRRVRNETNGYLDAYEPQERSLNEIIEVSELSRSWNHDPSQMPSSPPQQKRSFTRSTNSPIGTPEPSVSNHQATNRLSPFQPLYSKKGEEDDEDVQETSTKNCDANDSVLRIRLGCLSTQKENLSPDRNSVSSRIASNSWVASSRSVPSPHPLVSRIAPLPGVEPWTRTHYKALDKLYKIHRRHSSAFCPSAGPSDSLSQCNMLLLNEFLSSTKKPFIGARFSAWGYSMLMTKELIVLCAVYMQLLTLKSIDQYENIKGHIQIGDCGPGRLGDTIQGDHVVRRLATVIIGEAVRKDEKLGKVINKSEPLAVTWP